jgi:hypothetical protein
MPPAPVRPFRYYADPVCVASLVAYALNRFVLKPNGVGGDFVRCYLNDLLCLPLFLPTILYVQRRLGLRRTDAFPRAWEVVQHWLVFAVVFEVVLPRYPTWFRTTADPLDAVAYLVGGLAALLIWSRSRRVVDPPGQLYDPAGERVVVQH